MGFAAKADRFLSVAIETLILVLVVLSPWAFGAVEPVFEFFLYVGVGVLLVLWAGRVLCQGRFIWKKCPVALCLAALFLLGIWQLQPLPRPVLNVLSPGTIRLCDELMPRQPEVLPLGEIYERPALAAGNRLSLYPGATRKELIRLLAVFLLYAVVRNNAVSPASLRRLFIALVLNGCALAFFALFQFLTSPHNTVYWTYETKGAVFGPFISRTHYPFYLNICIGAGIGLMVQMTSAETPKKRRRRREAVWDEGTRGILNDPPRLWLGCALAFMAGSVALSLSRGGFLALLGGFGALLLLRRTRFTRLAWAGTGVVTLGVALALVSWLGGKRVEQRLATVWHGEAIHESRIPLWTDSLPLVWEFPLLGTGYGTFAYAEPLHREHTSSIFVHEHAHNEYLEAVIEGGVVRLGISLLAIWLVFENGYRAVRRYQGTPVGGLALGALFGFITLVIHSIGDFGIHLPAIAFLAVVLCAQLVALGRDEPSEKLTTDDTDNTDEGETAHSTSRDRQGADGPDALPDGRGSFPGEAPANAYVFGWNVLAPGIGAATAVALALVLGIEGRRLERIQAYRLMAASLQGKKADQDRQLQLRQDAARLAPESGRVMVELAQSHLDRFEERQAQRTRTREAVMAAELVLTGFGSSFAPLPGGWGQPNMNLAAAAWNAAAAEEGEELARKQLVPALRAYLQARDVCPLMARPHIRLAANLPYLVKADRRTAYLDRAKRVVTNDPELWFLFGAQEYLDGQYERAAQSWRRSLELSDQFLPGILGLARDSLGPKVLADEVLPNRPELLINVAERLYPGPKDANRRKPLLEKALATMLATPGPRKASDLFLQARLHALLGQPAEAAAAYRQALEQEPRQADWHMELAKFLVSCGKLAEARQELLTVLVLRPGDPQASELLAAVNRGLRKG